MKMPPPQPSGLSIQVTQWSSSPVAFPRVKTKPSSVGDALPPMNTTRRARSPSRMERKRSGLRAGAPEAAPSQPPSSAMPLVSETTAVPAAV